MHVEHVLRTQYCHAHKQIFNPIIGPSVDALHTNQAKCAASSKTLSVLGVVCLPPLAITVPIVKSPAFLSFGGWATSLVASTFVVHEVDTTSRSIRSLFDTSMDFAGADQTKDKRQLEEIFVLSNASNNGLLSVSELQGVLELMGKKCQQHELLQMITNVSQRATNDLDFEEFVRLMDTLLENPYTEAEISEAFESLAASGGDADRVSGELFIPTDRFRVRVFVGVKTALDAFALSEVADLCVGVVNLLCRNS